MTRILFSFLLFFASISFLFAQEGEWKGTITQDGKQYPMQVQFVREGKLGKIIGFTQVIVGDSIYGGRMYGKLNSDRSMNLWDHEENPPMFPDELPSTMRRRYQLIYKRSLWSDSLEGYWQQVHKGLDDVYKQGWIELKRLKKAETKA